MSLTGNTDSGTAITESVSHIFSNLCSCAFKLIETRVKNERMSFIEMLLPASNKETSL